MKSFIYYLLQFTYGILMNAIGFIVFLVVICFTHNVHRHYHSFYTLTKHSFGGISLGIFTICSNKLVLDHELGHSYQNIIFGPLFIFVVAIPSFIRYWYRRNRICKTFYEDIWFEKQATKLGTKFYKEWRQRQ